jgi:tRNA-dihydrouridine synthase B
MIIGKLKIGSDFALALAPMAGYTDIAFRNLMAKEGADLLYTELASATAISKQGLEKDSKTLKLIRCTKEKTTSIQLFGSKEKQIEDAIKLIEKKIDSSQLNAKIIDLNMGCPAPKVVRTGAGSALLKDSKKMQSIAQAAVDASISIPITLKLRLGFSKKNNISTIVNLQKTGVSAIAVHARTATQKFSSKADWSELEQIKKELTIPVIANGDIKTPEDAKVVLEKTGCDCAMIGRAALKNPFIFRQTIQYLKTGEYSKYSTDDKLNFLKDYCRECKKFSISYNSIKTLALELCTGFENSSKARDKIARSNSVDEIFDFFN